MKNVRIYPLGSDSFMTDKLTEKGIGDALSFSASIEVVDCTPSTNLIATQRLSEGCEAFHTVIARSQTVGEGRLGRSFFSPSHTGIYMTTVLYPSHEELGLITGMAAVAVCRALEGTGHTPRIKWVNDILINEKKVCGILAKSRIQNGKVGVLLGIGINVYRPMDGFPEDITSLAGYLAEKEEPGLKDHICSSILNELYRILTSESPAATVGAYRERCMTVGKDVTVIPAGDTKNSRLAKALYIDECYRLMVEYDDGEKALLNSGEVSVRPK